VPIEFWELRRLCRVGLGGHRICKSALVFAKWRVGDWLRLFIAFARRALYSWRAGPGQGTTLARTCRNRDEGFWVISGLNPQSEKLFHISILGALDLSL
ncbi:hypothetical protein HAX54_051926, partial [Datura stramonium]|nr:hypothetical protein [Datura stramonium]